MRYRIELAEQPTWRLDGSGTDGPFPTRRLRVTRAFDLFSIMTIQSVVQRFRGSVDDLPGCVARTRVDEIQVSLFIRTIDADDKVIRMRCVHIFVKCPAWLARRRQYRNARWQTWPAGAEKQNTDSENQRFKPSETGREFFSRRRSYSPLAAKVRFASTRIRIKNHNELAYRSNRTGS
jgi:hypothetical protein